MINQELTPSERLLETLQKSFEPLSRAELEELLPEISRRTIERALSVLQSDNVIEKIGKGRSTKYQFIN